MQPANPLPARSLLKCAGLAAVLFPLAACSDRQVYDSLQARERSECALQPANQYAACMERAERSYDEYRQARREADEAPP